MTSIAFLPVLLLNPAMHHRCSAGGDSPASEPVGTSEQTIASHLTLEDS